MTNKLSSSYMSTEITRKERAIAISVKKEFKDIVKKLENGILLITDLKDAITEQRPSKEDLKKNYRAKLMRYKNRTRLYFNDIIKRIKYAIIRLNQISDPEMQRLQKIIVSEFDELSDSIETFLSTLNDVERKDFTKTLEFVSVHLDKRKKSIKELVDNQLTNHIENNILGRVKISSLSDVQKRIEKRASVFNDILEKLKWQS